MIEKIVNSFRKVGVTAVAGYSALVIGLSCGDETNNNYYGDGGENRESECNRLCSKVWSECGGLPHANYNFGSSYNNCNSECVDFSEGAIEAGYTSELEHMFNCVSASGVSCEELEDDYCELEEGDIFNYNF